ncbi:Fiber protein Fb17 [Theobroma cacao]|uniref:Fiber protein Fb17 n=1 Tax=Theobroma cacao TaxID=3641 RepID=A0A061GWB3_THECC|nr:Fiber protein Fb17 [Theobroma cacao]
MSFPSQESQSEFNHCPDLTAMVHNVDQTPLAISPDDLTQRSMNSQFHPDVEVETGSVAQNGDGSSSWGLSSSDMPLDSYWKDLDVDLSSVAQTEDLSPISTSKTDTPRPGGGNANELPQQFNSSDQPLNSLAGNLTADQLVNSHGDVETGVRCSEPNQSHLDHEERPSDQASNGQKQRGRKPRVTPVEKAKNQLDQAGTSAKARNGQKRKSRQPIIRTEEQEHERKRKKNEYDRHYRADIKNELTELRGLKEKIVTIVSELEGIDQKGSQIDRVSPDLQKGQQEVVGNDMSQQVIIDSADRVPPIWANEVPVSISSDKYEEMEADCRRLQRMKSKYGEIEKIESMLDKFKNLEAESRRFKQIKLLFGGVDEIEREINRLKKIELQLDKYKQMETTREMDSFQASPGSLQQKVADLDRFEQMKPMNNGIKKMEFMLDKFPKIEAALQEFEQIKSDFGGIYKIKAGIYGLKKIESQRDKQKEPQFFTKSPGSLQEQRGMHSLDLNSDSDVASDDGINLKPPAAVGCSKTIHDMQYSDALVTKFMAKLDDDNAVSNVDHSSFKDLDGECEKVGKYNIPLSLVSTARDIIKAKDDITKQSRFGHCVIEPAYILLCATTKEMRNLPPEQVTEEIMLKWRDAINDAKGLRCDTEFAMKYLRKFAQGYFGLKANNDRKNLEQRMTILKTEEEVLKKELQKKTSEMKFLKSKQEDLTSEQCKDCLEFKNQILTKTIRLFD